MSRCRYPDHHERRVIWLVLLALAIGAGLFVVAAVRGQEPAREVVVLCFTQNACPQCVVQKPNWASFKRANPSVKVVNVDTNEHPGATRQWKVETTPTTIIALADSSGDSIERRRFVGVTSSQAIKGALP